jgi:ABC-type transporter Mla subunit MlaD
LGQTIDSLGTVAANARTEIPNLEALLTQLAHLTAALGPTGNQIDSIATNLDQVLPTLNQPDQVNALLDDVSQVASDLSEVLEGHQAGLNATLNGLSAVAAALSPRAPELPVLTQSLNSFFTLLSGIIHEPGETLPGGLLAGNIQGVLPTDPCSLFVGVCPGQS